MRGRFGSEVAHEDEDEVSECPVGKGGFVALEEGLRGGKEGGREGWCECDED